MSRVNTCCTMTLLVSVLAALFSARSFKKIPFGKHDGLITQHDESECKRMRHNCWLHIAPMVLTVQMIALVSFVGMTLGPWNQN